MISRLSRRAVLIGLAAAGVGPALAQSETSERDPAFDHAVPEMQRIPIELVEEALELEAGIRVGARRGDVTLIEFFDYNCPWCRRSAAELPALLADDPDLTLVLMNYPILGERSVEAARVALGFFELNGPDKYLALHRRLFELRGVVDGRRSLAEGEAAGQDVKALANKAESDVVKRRLDDALRIGRSLGLDATPSLVLGPEAYPGYVGLEAKRAIVARARA